MATVIQLDPALDEAVQELIRSGDFESPLDVFRAGVALVAARAARLAEFDAAIAESVAEADAGLTVDADKVFDELIARYSAEPRAAE